MRPSGFFLFLAAVLAMGACSKPFTYENPSLSHSGDALTFSGDPYCVYRPMPLNTDVDFAKFHDKWGVLWVGAYNNPAAINRTLFMSVLYMGAVGEDLEPINARPIKIAEGEGNIATYAYPTDRGVSVIYDRPEGGYECALLDMLSTPPKTVAHTCRFDAPILRNGRPNSDWALRFHRGETYALSVDSGLALVRSSDGGSHKIISQITHTKKTSTVTHADLWIDDEGAAVVWDQRVADCETPESGNTKSASSCKPFTYAFLPKGSKEWRLSPIDLPGSAPQQVHLEKDGHGQFALLQLGSQIFRQEFDPVTKVPSKPSLIFDIAEHKAPGLSLSFLLSTTDIRCAEGECVVTFPASSGRSWAFSTKTGLHSREGLAGLLRCYGDKCLQRSYPGEIKRYVPHGR